MTSWDEARHCPKCGEAGHEISVRSGPRRSRVHVLKCENKRCKWFDSSWVVQVKSDGTIPERKPGFAEFPALSRDQEAMARRVLEDIAFEQTGQDPTRNRSLG